MGIEVKGVEAGKGESMFVELAFTKGDVQIAREGLFDVRVFLAGEAVVEPERREKFVEFLTRSMIFLRVMEGLIVEKPESSEGSRPVGAA